MIDIVDIVFCSPSIWALEFKNSKNVNFSPRDCGNVYIDMVQLIWALEHSKCHFRSK